MTVKVVLKTSERCMFHNNRQRGRQTYSEHCHYVRMMPKDCLMDTLCEILTTESDNNYKQLLHILLLQIQWRGLNSVIMDKQIL